MLNVQKRLVTGALAAMVFGVCAGANATEILKFDFEDHDAVADVVAAGLTSTDFTNGGGLTHPSFASGAAAARGWHTSDNADEAEEAFAFWTFTLSAQPGYAFDVTSLSLDEWSEEKGPIEFQLWADGDLLESALSTNGSLTNHVIVASFDDVTELVVRILGWGAQNNGNDADWHVDNVTVNGSVTQLETGDPGSEATVPEPASLLLLGTGLLLVARRARARS